MTSTMFLPWQNLLMRDKKNLFSGLTALTAEFTVGEGKLMTHDEPCSMAPDDKHDLISGLVRTFLKIS